jgi:hypothetical protein
MMSQEQKDQAAGIALLVIWNIIHAQKEKTGPQEILKRIAQEISLLPPELLNAINAEVRQRKDR